MLGRGTTAGARLSGSCRLWELVQPFQLLTASAPLPFEQLFHAAFRKSKEEESRGVSGRTLDRLLLQRPVSLLRSQICKWLNFPGWFVCSFGRHGSKGAGGQEICAASPAAILPPYRCLGAQGEQPLGSVWTLIVPLLVALGTGAAPGGRAWPEPRNS